MTQESLFVAEADGLEPTEWAVGPWSPDTLQGSAHGGVARETLSDLDGPFGACGQALLFERRQQTP